MNELRKILRYDFISAVPVTGTFCGIALAVCLITALFGVPLGLISFPLAAVFFASAKELSKSSDVIEGVLPASRNSFIRSKFAELTLSFLAGGAMAVLFYLLSCLKLLTGLLPEKLEHSVRAMDGFLDTAGVTMPKLCGIIVIFSAYFCAVIAAAIMVMELCRHKWDTVIMAAMGLATLILLSVFVDKTAELPIRTVIIISAAAFLGSLMISLICCQVTCRISKDLEI